MALVPLPPGHISFTPHRHSPSTFAICQLANQMSPTTMGNVFYTMENGFSTMGNAFYTIENAFLPWEMGFLQWEMHFLPWEMGFLPNPNPNPNGKWIFYYGRK